MAEFKGSDFQIDVQKRMLTRHSWIKNTPEIANGGRVLNFLEPDATGWDDIGKYLAEDGVVALTAQPKETILQAAFGAFGAGYDYPTWDIYTATDAHVSTQCQAVLQSYDLPHGWKVECFKCPNDSILEDVQTLNLETGVAPYPGFFTRSEVVPNLTACLWDSNNILAATSSVNARYHPKSRFGSYVFKGSTSVKPEYRGKSLGKIVNAHVLLESQNAMGWTHAISQVSRNNVASQKTIASSGFERQTNLVTQGIVAKGQVFTR